MVLHFGRATSVFMKTLPFVLLRIAVGVALGLFTVLYFGAVVWIGTSLLDAGTISGWIAGIGLLVAVALFVWIWRLVSKYLLYLITAGHIAVVVHVLETGDPPADQFRYGTEQVKERFAEASALFAVDKLVKAVLEEFNRSVVSVADRLGAVPTLEKLVRLVGKAIAVAVSYVDEAILAYGFTEDADDDPWRSAKDGVVLYGENWKPVLGSTLLIVIGLYAAAAVLFLALAPVASVFAELSPAFEIAGWIVVAGLTLTIYAGVLKPWVKTVVITTFLLESADGDRRPDDTMADRIARRSDAFQELERRADAERTTDEREASEPAAPEASAP